MYPLSGTMELSSAYADGRCRDCGANILPLGPLSRCDDCEYDFTQYTDSGWGLNDLINERDQNYQLGLCFYCGNGLDNQNEHLCMECQLQSENGQWSRSQYRRGRLASSDRNPYINVWENNDVDHAVHLGLTYSVIARRLLSKAKYYKQKAERGGPIGRKHLQDARIYIRIAAKMLEMEREIERKSH